MRVPEVIDREARRIEEDADYTSRANFQSSLFHSRLHRWLGVAAAVLAAGAGSTALAESPPWIPGALGFAAAVIGAVITFMKAGELAAVEQTAGANYLALRNQCRRFRTIEALAMTPEQQRSGIQELGQRQDELNLSVPPTARRFFEAARDSIEAGETRHSVDDGPPGQSLA